MKAGLVVKPDERPWSSASAHLSSYDDTLVKTAPLLEITAGTWKKDFLTAQIGEKEIRELGRHEHAGRSLGSGSLVENLEIMLGRILKPKKAGRRPKSGQK